MFLTTNEACFLTTNDVIFNNERNGRNNVFLVIFTTNGVFYLTTKEAKGTKNVYSFFLLLSLDSLFVSNCNMEKCLTVVPLI